MKDRDRDAADDWMREHMPSEDEFSLEDNDERGCEERYYFLRGRDSAMVVYRIRVKGGRVVSVRRRYSSMKTSKANRRKSGGSSGRKAERIEPRLVEAPAVDEPVSVAAIEPVQPASAPEPEKKRKGRAPLEGEPLRRV